jgi:hypothetical protein
VNTEASGRAEQQRFGATHGNIVQEIAGVKNAASKVVGIVEGMINMGTCTFLNFLHSFVW